MLFDTIPFFVFFTIVMILYYNVPANKQTWLLLIAGLVFYSWQGPVNLVIPALLISITWFTANSVAGVVSQKKKNSLLTTGIVLNLLVLVFFKYTGFLVSSLESITGSGYTDQLPAFLFGSFIIPLGISYMSFQAIGYLIDLKKETLPVEKNALHLTTYLFFFPKIVAGPVEKAADFLPQVKKGIAFDYDAVSSGIRQFGFGLFKKLVIADRLGLFVNSVYGDLYNNSGYSLLIAAIIFPVQLYADFSGYTDMAIGIARVLGYKLSPNFNMPFSAKSIVEFWRKWHISLSTWFNEYIYTPLAIHKRNWGKWGVVYASMVTFLILGFWHGPNWTYVIFGGIQGFFISIELFTTRARKRIRKKMPVLMNTAAGIMYVLVIFSLSCIFFRSSSVHEALYFINHLFSGEQYTGSIKTALQNHSLSLMDYVVLAITIPFMFFAETKKALEKITFSPLWVRWLVYYLFLTVIIVYGISSGPGFIYKQF